MSRKETQHVRAGFEVGTGKEVSPPLAHTFVAGQTQLSGKTTTLRAIVIRSGRRALAFVTKRGEEFEGRRIRPYLPREGDRPIHWRFVETILASALGQRNMKYERYWIVAAAKGARTLEDVRRNVDRLRAKAKGSTAETYELIGEYLDLVLPEMRALDASDELELESGLNVIDVSGSKEQLQALVIRAALEHINEQEENVLSVFPEAWQFAPRGRVTPASAPAVDMARKGAVLGNFLLCDSQDLAGVDTTIRQAASVWMLGVQRELNELRRTLQMIPAGIRKPKPVDVTSLRRGEFMVCWGDQAIRTYIQPAWMPADVARDVALGKTAPADVEQLAPLRVATIIKPIPQTGADEMSAEDVKAIRGEIGALTKAIQQFVAAQTQTPPAREKSPRNHDDEPSRFADAGDDVDNRPARLSVTTSAPRLSVDVQPRELTATELEPRGRVATLIAEGFFREPQNGNAAYQAWKKRGFTGSSTRIYEALASLTKDGLLIMGPNKTYQQHPLLEVDRNGKQTVTLTINYK